MSLSDSIGDTLTKFEKYNGKEVYNFGNFVVTGRLVSAFVGFLVIVLMLMVTFSSAANSIIITELGGTTAFTADVVITENTGPSFSGTLNNEGDFVDFGYVLEELDWDYTSNMRISYFDVTVDWNPNGGAGGGRQITFDVSSQNDTVGESQNDGGNGGIVTTVWVVQAFAETVSDTSDNAESFLLSFETAGEWMGGKFTYSQESIGSSIALSESIDYTITLTYYTWDFENVREIAEI
ncbi:MAG: hypothetical protein CMB06_04665 [Euryarchaeota archaeon]|nr:hypothetical protein [Euryarchaeota archaeon]